MPWQEWLDFACEREGGEGMERGEKSRILWRNPGTRVIQTLASQSNAHCDISGQGKATKEKNGA